VTLVCTYFSPTTPTATTWSEDLTPYIRLASITGLAGEARLGATGEGNVVFDDETSSIGHLNDGILGLKQMFFDETACPAGNQRMWTGYIYDRRYRRNVEHSLILGTAREIDVTLVDVNDFLSFRVFAPTADDPTSDFDRPAETHIQRVQALLTTVDFLSTTLFDIGYIPTTGGVAMSAKDYTGMRPIDVLNDCAQVSGWNFWVLYDETGNQLVLWFDVWTTDGSSTLAYDSALRLTNVASDHDGVTTFAIEPDAVETLDPSRLASAAYGTGDGVTGYETKAATANIYAWRDMVVPQAPVKDQAKLDALLTRYLNDNDTEDPKITCTVRLPASKVTGIHEGMRLQVLFTHLPLVFSGYTWTRVLQRTIRQDQETEEFYWLDLELSPIPITCPNSYVDGYVPPLGAPNGPTVNADGRTIYGRAGGAFPIIPTPYYTGGSPWHFPEYQHADAGSHNGWTDFGIGYVRCFGVGPGTMVIYTNNTQGAGPCPWALQHWDPDIGYVTDDSGNIAGGRNETTVTFPDDGFCTHWVNVGDLNGTPSGLNKTYFDGFLWTNV